MLRRLLLLPLLLLAPFAAQAQVAPLTPEQTELKSTVQFLSADSMRGREAGTRDFDVAADFMASQYMAAGLKPGGANGSWFQPVSLVSYRPTRDGTMALTRGKTLIPMAYGKDFLSSPVPSSPEFKASGQVVFVGYGIVYPEGKRDDYKGLDVRGKVVAFLPGVPKGFPTEVAAHLGDDDQKARFAAARGAVGVVTIESNQTHEDYAFDRIVPYWAYERTTWASPDGKAFDVSPAAPVFAYVSWAGAEKLFAGSKIKWADVLAADKKGAKIPTGALGVTMDAVSKTRNRFTKSHNVVAVLEGSDPVLKDQYVILSAHLDHVGVGEAVGGDSIYNGAMDNAVGSASILQVARMFQRSGKRPRRTIIFLSLTAEEKGLIGSSYYAHNPTVPKEKIVADVNLDMPILTYAVEDLVVQGGERSSIGPVVAQVAAGEGLKVVPDPTPEENFFVRSDHYSFVQSGIPSVSIDTGPGGPGAAAQKYFLDNNYHKPSDQIDLPFNWDSAAKFVRINYGVARIIADADQRPSWNKGDFFGVLFDGYGAK
ncbi:M28 family metallopeptidase [Sphingomonas sp. LB-2]|uniref:M28 family metallopeptidase n=1 Tax=Sphingomonas caeni TaxID=2984949 RepID=UPI00222FAC6F|nr:M28 family metallopeptidase [Sphingomonas caeni]MCW3846371.1 M28 family metallopeptidase [Sphingomonas caeni]